MIKKITLWLFFVAFLGSMWFNLVAFDEIDQINRKFKDLPCNLSMLVDLNEINNEISKKTTQSKQDMVGFLISAQKSNEIDRELLSSQLKHWKKENKEINDLLDKKIKILNQKCQPNKPQPEGLPFT